MQNNRPRSETKAMAFAPKTDNNNKVFQENTCSFMFIRIVSNFSLITPCTCMATKDTA